MNEREEKRERARSAASAYNTQTHMAQFNFTKKNTHQHRNYTTKCERNNRKKGIKNQPK